MGCSVPPRSAPLRPHSIWVGSAVPLAAWLQHRGDPSRTPTLRGPRSMSSPREWGVATVTDTGHPGERLAPEPPEEAGLCAGYPREDTVSLVCPPCPHPSARRGCGRRAGIAPAARNGRPPCPGRSARELAAGSPSAPWVSTATVSPAPSCLGRFWGVRLGRRHPASSWRSSRFGSRSSAAHPGPLPGC